jgi:hypothetical protein
MNNSDDPTAPTPGRQAERSGCTCGDCVKQRMTAELASRDAEIERLRAALRMAHPKNPDLGRIIDEALAPVKEPTR